MKKPEENRNANNAVFLLEENVTRAFALAIDQVGFQIHHSKFTYEEIAKELGMDRNTFSKKFKNREWTAKQFYELLLLLNKKFSRILEEIKEKEKTKTKK